MMTTPCKKIVESADHQVSEDFPVSVYRCLSVGIPDPKTNALKFFLFQRLLKTSFGLAGLLGFVEFVELLELLGFVGFVELAEAQSLEPRAWSVEQGAKGQF